MSWFKPTIETLRLKTEQGDAAAMRMLGQRYLEGDGVAKDRFEALQYLCLAALKGDVEAGLIASQVFASIYEDTERGNATALYELGGVYRLGVGVPVDREKARHLYSSSARLGHVNAQISLGIMLLELGNGESDALEALGWLKKAAESRSAHASYLIGLIYLKGIGVKEDSFEAEEWLCQAARGEHAEAKEMYVKVKMSNVLKLLNDDDVR